MERPNLDKTMAVEDFNAYYWLKQELIDFCKTVGLSTVGGKIEISDRIRHYLSTGIVTKTKSPKVQSTSRFNWDSEVLTRDTLITDNYKNGAHVRRFFIQEIGPHFTFNIIFMKWIKAHTGKNLGDAIQAWHTIYAMKQDKNYVSEIDPQFEYNRYMRAFLRDNPELSRNDAMKYWKLKRMQRGTMAYDRKDLDLQ